LKIILTLKPGLVVTQGHWKWHHLIYQIWVCIHRRIAQFIYELWGCCMA